jgi:hypothetical protein
MVRLGFSGSALGRCALGGVYALGAALLVWAVEWREPVTTQPQRLLPPPSETTAARYRVRLESAFPVRQWSIQVDGQPIVAQFSDPQQWSGEVPASGQELLIEATASDTHPVRAMRAVINGREHRLFAGDPFLATVRLDPPVTRPAPSPAR